MVPARRPVEGPTVGAGQLVGGQPGMSAGFLSGQEGCDGKLQERSQAKHERFWSRTTALLCTRSHKRPVELFCGHLWH